MNASKLKQTIVILNIALIYCMCGSTNKNIVDSEMEENSDSAENEITSDLARDDIYDPLLEDMTSEEIMMDMVDLDNVNACEQELPSVVSGATYYCSEDYPDSCLINPCGECQVCFVDISCWPRDSDDATNCGCTGDGLCHVLCNSNSDCSVEEECINLAWANYTDIVGTACLKVCWPIDDPSVIRCSW